MHKGFPKTNIRSASSEDLKDIYKIERQAFKKINYPLFVLRQFYDLFPDLIIVAVSETNEILGYILGGISSDRKFGWGLALATKKKQKKRGVAKALFKELISRFKLKGIKKIRLTVKPDNVAALHLVQKLGFEKIESFQNYFGDKTNRFLFEMYLGDKK